MSKTQLFASKSKKFTSSTGRVDSESKTPGLRNQASLNAMRQKSLNQDSNADLQSKQAAHQGPIHSKDTIASLNKRKLKGGKKFDPK